ncbi:hypothetical protein GM658_20990 [Pseudoduganella eburnea]|uniref:Uncharacterized protein n=1 Tax=Massilia eburnea TaxID=1776165 RepID=A0A6L6QMF5_9BURK|nr:hypothetical protein [Massilia eburnea]MTW13087.1 hypothetical protein [Massilia eburnea]
MKKLFAWFKRRSLQQKSPVRKPAPHWDQSAAMPEFMAPEVPDYTSRQEADSFQSFPQDSGWQPPSCDAPSFDSSASFSSPSSCDTSSSSFSSSDP